MRRKTELTKKVIELRKAGYDYIDIAESLNVDRKKVNHICIAHNVTYGDLGDQMKPEHDGHMKLKGRAVVDWQERIDQLSDGNFEVINRTIGKNHETFLTVVCRKCGAVKTISAITLRNGHRKYCVECQMTEMSSPQK